MLNTKRNQHNLVEMLAQSEKDLLTRQFEDGLSLEELADAYGLTVPTMGRVLARIGLIERSDVLSYSDEAMLALVKSLGIHTAERLKEVINGSQPPVPH